MLAALDLDGQLERDAADLDVLLVKLEREQLEGSFYEFVKGAWHLVEPGKEFQDNWHIRVLCRVLEDCYYGKIKRLVINVPPGTMKSLLVNVFFPAWIWAKDPRKRILSAAYGQHLSTRDNLRTRQIIESPWFQKYWAVQLADDQKAKTRYNTNRHGWRFATSVRGAGTGEHPDFIIIDDPHSAMEAASDAEREAGLGWFDNTIATRLGRNPCIIIVMQRLHQSDLSGHLLKRGEFKHVRWPMRYEICICPRTAPNCHPDEEQRCPLHKADPTWTIDELDERTENGELLWPSMHPEDKVKSLELNLGPYGAAGQLQQRPSPEGGGLFKRENFRYIELVDVAALLKHMRVVRCYDTASTPGGGDYTACAKIGELFQWKVENGKRTYESTGQFYVLHAFRDQLSPSDVDKLFMSFVGTDGKKVAIRELREPGGSGKAVTEARRKMLKGYDYDEILVTHNKVTMAKPFRAQVEGRNVWLVRDIWNEEFVRELTTFPTGDHDDWVDAASNGFNAVLLEPVPGKDWVVL